MSYKKKRTKVKWGDEKGKFVRKFCFWEQATWILLCSGSHNAQMGTNNGSLDTHKALQGNHNSFDHLGTLTVLITVK